MSQKKSVLFQQLLPVIKQYQQSGFTHEKIVELLKDQHDLNLVTVKTFKSYLYRYA
ncbi:MAG: aminotransferase, partial [Acinetobacter baumannii]|nr:aminotransferase [Acinetobacter baumannii]